MPTGGESTTRRAWRHWFQNGALKLRHLRVILEIDRMKSISLAARELNLTQPAVTKALQEIEEAAGMALFERTAEGSRPTHAGTSLLLYARDVFSTIARAGDELESLSVGLHGRLIVGCNLPSAVEIVPRALMELVRQHEGLSVTLKEATLEALLPGIRDRHIDVVVARRPSGPDGDDLIEHMAFGQPMTIAAGRNHPLVGKQRVTWSDLGQCQWLMPPRGSAVRSELEALFKAKGIDPPLLRLESSSPTANTFLVQEFAAVCLVPQALLASREHPVGALAPVKIDIPRLAFNRTSVMTLKGRELSPAESAFIECLRHTVTTG